MAPPGARSGRRMDPSSKATPVARDRLSVRFTFGKSTHDKLPSCPGSTQPQDSERGPAAVLDHVLDLAIERLEAKNSERPLGHAGIAEPPRAIFVTSRRTFDGLTEDATKANARSSEKVAGAAPLATISNSITSFRLRAAVKPRWRIRVSYVARTTSTPPSSASAPTSCGAKRQDANSKSRAEQGS